MITENETENTPRWTFLSPVERRVVGVLVEKAKTTPNTYPLTLNAIIVGSNQKSNRFPMMDLNEDRAEEALEGLRLKGAVILVEGAGRVPKYRHKLYEWLGVDKVELAVMAELLLRGTQTEGELRARAARMEPIADVGQLRPILERLAEKNLIVRWGRIVTHNLYSPAEMERQKQQYAFKTDSEEIAPVENPNFSPNTLSSPLSPPSHFSPTGNTENKEENNGIPSELRTLKELVEKLTAEQETLTQEVAQLRKSLETIQRDLGML
ncbi:MAG: DUF480 domain-containing protein [Planctomycetia bacterium]|nr:DUF480 domain-containing protein [Planctomycetia bacterium]